MRLLFLHDDLLFSLNYFFQPYSQQPCSGCKASVTKSRSAHWEGGKGCRDKVSMSRLVMATIMALPPFSATITSFGVLLFLETITKNTVSWERQHHERLRNVLKERAKVTRGSEYILNASCGRWFNNRTTINPDRNQGTDRAQKKSANCVDVLSSRKTKSVYLDFVVDFDYQGDKLLTACIFLFKNQKEFYHNFFLYEINLKIICTYEPHYDANSTGQKHSGQKQCYCWLTS